jgi:LysM repeat protein
MTRSAGSVNMEWTNDVTVQLISEYQKHVVLFYKLVNKKNDACEEIAKEVGISVPQVKKKLNNGRN